ncbi:MAG: hypothetical protein JWO38_7740 [Gemmataceae bacterium]|nr:hypothetical protein [Gemmataceae bacterium]
MVRSALCAAGLFLGSAGFALFVSLGVGVWATKREADRQVAAAAEKAQTAADLAARVIALIRDVIARAQAGLAAARADPDTAPPGATPDPLVRAVVWKAKRDLPGDVEKARDAVGVASEAVVVAGAALDAFGERPADETVLGIRPEHMHTARTQLDTAAADLRNARHVLGIPIPAANGVATPDQLANVDGALVRASEVTNQFDEALSRARHKVDETRRRAEVWSLRAAAGITALAALAALGQVFMVRACWRGLRVRPAA